MIFSKACEYSIRATVFITLQSMEDKRVNLKEISKEIGSPEAFTAKLLQQLKKHKIVNSVQGTNGGFEIKKDQMKITKLGAIVAAIDGTSNFTLCLIGLNECSEKKPCPIHHSFKKIRSDMNTMLENTSLWSMAMKMKEGKTYLKL